MTKNRTIQLYRGTTAQNDAYTGSVGELTMDTTTNELRLHDGSTAGGHKIGSGGYTPNIFDWKWADHELDDMSWLRADTGSWQDGTVYSDAYNHLVNDISGKSSTSETIAGIPIQFYLADDGHKICLSDQELYIEMLLALTGVAWYYVLDISNTKFMLPRTQHSVVGYRNGVGKYVPETLPNITGSTTDRVLTGNSSTNPEGHGSGAIRFGAGVKQGANAGSGTFLAPLTIDASLSSSTYQNDAPVQERATQQYLYFYVGQFSQTATEQTAGLNAELFNGKADVDLHNITSAGQNVCAKMTLPNTSRYTELTIGASDTTYTAPADGWFSFHARIGNIGYGVGLLYDNGFACRSNCCYNNQVCGVVIPVNKGQVVTISYGAFATTNPLKYLRFYYANGAQ